MSQFELVVHDVFISYSRDDHREHAALIAKAIKDYKWAGSFFESPTPPARSLDSLAMLGDLAQDAEVAASFRLENGDAVLTYRIRNFAAWLKRRATARGWSPSVMMARLLCQEASAAPARPRRKRWFHAHPRPSRGHDR